MADTRLTDKTAISTIADGDKFHIVDVSDATANAAGTSKTGLWSLLKSTLKTVNDALYVAKTLFNANTILAATTDDTPAALTVGASTFLGRKATGNISAMSVTESQTLLQDRILEDATTITTQDLDYSLYETFNFTVTGAVTFTESNLPTSGSNGKVILINITGNFALTFPSGWSTNITGAYDGTVNNTIVVWYIKASTYKVTITQPT